MSFDSDAPGGAAISVHGLSKCYEIYARPEDRLKQSIMPRLRRLAGLEGHRYYREFWALHDVSFQVGRGECVGIVGRNGSGKSTLLQIICGTLAPTTGSVTTSGRVAALLELGSGFNPEFTGRENVYMSAALYGLSARDTDAIFDDVAAFADIGDFVEQPVKLYSSGMYLRLAFAVIAHVKADILIVDEALAVGDAFFTQKCMRYLRGFMETNTVLFVSHDTGAVRNLCSRAIWLESGRLHDQGSPKEVTERYLEAFFEAEHGKSSTIRIRPEYAATKEERLVDQRARISDTVTLRNDIEVFRFDPSAGGFGAGALSIIDVKLQDTGGRQLAWALGEEIVRVVVSVMASSKVESVIVGFFVKDRLGQALFGDNTFMTHRDAPINAESGDVLEAVFEFAMPRFATGDYSISAAVATGTQRAHVLQHWVHDAMFFKSSGDAGVTGIIGLPMRRIELIRRAS